MNSIKLYNTKSKSIEDFAPINNGKVGIYSCGPTVYHYAHIGNLRAYVFADILRKTLTHAGYAVNHIINITDVGHLVGDGDMGIDKLESSAKREGKSAYDVAHFYEEAFMRDLALLNIDTTNYTFPRATDNIPEQIALVQQLEEKGYTYSTSDGIYFDTSKFSHYKDLAQLDIKGLQSGARVEENLEKKNITDFALWKFSPHSDGLERRHMEWESPWGIGFPGWHIECSAMSMKFLGNHFDIHTGGIDHIPVHHTNEIAQSECATGETYANYWMHVNFLNDTTGKMSKSNDDFLTLEVLREKNLDPLAYRYFLLTTHYRKEVTFSYDALGGASTAYKKLISWCEDHRTDLGNINKEYLERFETFLYDDLATPSCIAEMWNLTKDTNVPQEERYRTLVTMGEILGLPLSLATKKEVKSVFTSFPLADKRQEAKKNKDYVMADTLRKEIEELGYSITDYPDGTYSITEK